MFIPQFSIHLTGNKEAGYNIERLKAMPANSVDAIVTDCPYGFGNEPDPIKMLQAWITTGYLEVSGGGFMGKKWDAFVPQPAFWKEAFRVLKPGGYVLAFFGTRTYHWGTMAIAIAGFEIRDQMDWIYGSGFPKSLDISKSLAGIMANNPDVVPEVIDQWKGYGTALKPAHEPICVARKPLDGTVAGNVMKHGCGGINLDGCRIETTEIAKDGGVYNANNYFPGLGGGSERKMGSGASNDLGRFPANIILDEAAGQVLDEQTGTLTSGIPSGVKNALNNIYGDYGLGIPVTGYGDSGGASRFFYCAKASTADRNYGCDDIEAAEKTGSYEFRQDGSLDGKTTEDAKNNHPTVKPISLMRYLVRLVKTPLESCVILDPFMGSGTTGIACMLEGINFEGCEMEDRSFTISAARIQYAQDDYIREQKKPVQIELF